MQTDQVDFAKIAVEATKKALFDIACSMPGFRFVEEIINQAHWSDSFGEKRKLSRSLKNKQPSIRFRNQMKHISGCPECQRIFTRSTQILNEKCATLLG